MMKALYSALFAFVLISPSSGIAQTLQEELRFQSRGVELVGTLFLPSGAGPHPVIVGAHGSGHVDRTDLYQRVPCRGEVVPP